MPLGNLVFIGGFMGSHLDRAGLFLLYRRYWFDVAELLLGSLGFLELKNDGNSPANPFTGTVKPAGVLESYYGQVTRHLAKEWNVFVVSHDWRKGLVTTASQLLTAIEQEFPNQSYYIIGHSQGGLLARFLWREAGFTGTQGRIRRIVTVGTPHWGSYSAVKAFTRQSETYRSLLHFSFPAIALAITPIEMLQGVQPNEYLDRVVTSWPALYEMFPNPQQPPPTNDPHRAVIYNIANWQAVNTWVNPSGFTSGASTMTLLAGADTQPPDAILVCIVGRGVGTSGALVGAGNPFGGTQYVIHDGDGTVTERSARLRSAAVELPGDHMGLMRQAVVQTDLNRLLLDGLPAQPPVERHTAIFTVPGPSGPLGDPSALPPRFGEILDFERGTPRAPTADEPRPSYCP